MAHQITTKDGKIMRKMVIRSRRLQPLIGPWLGTMDWELWFVTIVGSIMRPINVVPSQEPVSIVAMLFIYLRIVGHFGNNSSNSTILITTIRSCKHKWENSLWLIRMHMHPMLEGTLYDLDGLAKTYLMLVVDGILDQFQVLSERLDSKSSIPTCFREVNSHLITFGGPEFFKGGWM